MSRRSVVDGERLRSFTVAPPPGAGGRTRSGGRPCGCRDGSAAAARGARCPGRWRCAPTAVRCAGRRLGWSGPGAAGERTMSPSQPAVATECPSRRRRAAGLVEGRQLVRAPEERADVVEGRSARARLVRRRRQLDDVRVRERVEPLADLGERLVRVLELRDQPQPRERRTRGTASTDPPCRRDGMSPWAR